MHGIILFNVILLSIFSLNAQDSCLPLWPRLQFGGIFSDATSTQKMVIRFNTKSECQKSYAQVSDSKGTIRKVYCQSSQISTSSKMESYKTFIQRCSIQSIQFQQRISYFLYGSNQTSGKAIPFTDIPIETSILHPNSSKTVKFVVLADWSQLHQKINIYKSVNQSLDKLRIQQKIDGIIVNGDIAYDLDSNKGVNYEQFLNIISRVARYVPIFLSTGNHQHNSDDDIKLFYNTFQQYGKDKKLATGLNFGPLYFIGFDPYETIYKTSYFQIQNLRKAESVAIEGLAEAIANGTKTGKIIIASSHYPLKCSAPNKNCQNDTKILKSYFDLMFQNDIKFYIGAHYHTYERIYPYCEDGTFKFVQPPYNLDKQKCIISIIEGIAGNDDKIVQSYPDVKNYTAALSYGQTGVGLLSVQKSKIKFQHFSSENILTLKDQFDIIYKGQNVKSVEEQIKFLQK